MYSRRCDAARGRISAQTLAVDAQEQWGKRMSQGGVGGEANFGEEWNRRSEIWYPQQARRLGPNAP